MSRSFGKAMRAHAPSVPLRIGTVAKTIPGSTGDFHRSFPCRLGRRHEHENIPPFEGGQRSRRGREGDVPPAGTRTPPGWLRHHPAQEGIFTGANENLLPAESLHRL